MKKFACSAIICLLMTGCLKTRAQLRDDDSNGAAAGTPQPAQTQEVTQNQSAVDDMKNEMTRLEGRLEDIERTQKDASSAQNNSSKDDMKKLEARVVELEQAQAQMLVAIKQVQDSQATAKATESINYFDQGRKQFDAGSFDAAVESFTEYLKTSKADRVEDATFLRAESYYSLKQFKKAIVDYSKFPEKFPKSKLMPTALYRIGRSFENLGMNEDAKGFYQELLDKFPKSPEAKKARAKVK
jgi:tol-pal system protein YbgF